MSAAENKLRASEYGRSVVDYVTAQELDAALSTVPQEDAISSNDWVLPVPDPEAEEQTREGELERLLTLKSYMLLDAEKEEEFDKLTLEAREAFGVPTSLISLIDLGRQFLFSNTGANGVRETSRQVAFCSHTILNKNGLLEVKDTKEDARFKDSTLVTEGPKLRFYAGAPLISPEGTKRASLLHFQTGQRSHSLTFASSARPIAFTQVTSWEPFVLKVPHLVLKA